MALFCIPLLSQTGLPFLLPIRVTMAGKIYKFEAGIADKATYGFDQGLDKLTAPPPRISPYAYFMIDRFPNFLQTDMRSPGQSVVWVLKVVDTKHQKVSVEWDLKNPERKQSAGYKLVLNKKVDMLKIRTIQFMGDSTLQLIYTGKDK
jgi:hypothetical protein